MHIDRGRFPVSLSPRKLTMNAQTSVAVVAPVVAQVATVAPVAPVAPVAAKPVVEIGVRFVLLNRPGSGNGKGMLAAHTAAAFEALGLFQGSAVSRQTLARVWGQTAIGWHTGGNDKPSAFIQYVENGVPMLELNETGLARFAPRGIDPSSVEMFFDLLTTGKSATAPRAFSGVKPL